MTLKRTLRRLRRDQSGVAAIEMALIMPVLLIILFGMIDVTALLSDHRRLTYSANAVANLVTKLESPATPAQIDDAFKAVDLVMRSAREQQVRVEIHNYRKNTSTGAVNRKWSYDDGAGGRPCTPPTTGTLLNLMNAGNDVVVAVTCAEYKLILAEYTNWRTLKDVTKITMREQITTRPRFSLLLECPDCTNYN